MTAPSTVPGRLLAGLAAVLASLPALAQVPVEAGLRAADLRAPADLAGLLDRDARLGFPRTQASELQVDLRRPDGATLDRAAALLGAGCLRLEAERARLEEQAAAEDGAELERRAAVLALGELGPRSTGFLRGLLTREDASLAETAAVALLRTGSAEGRDELQQLAAGGGPLARAAAALLAFERDQDAAEVPASLELLYQLRWEAARRYGLIDGRSWKVFLLEELAENQSFLDLVVLPVAARHSFSGLADHLLETLLRGRGIGRIQAAVIGMPAQLERLVLSGVWRPGRDSEWIALVDAIGEHGESQRLQGALTLAAASSPARGRALELLAELGVPQAEVLLEEQLNAPNPLLRAEVAQALGGTGDRAWSGELERMRKDPNPEVRAAALVAQARIGHGPANTRLGQLAEDTADAERAAVVEYLLRVVDEQRARFWLEEVLRYSEDPAERRRIALGLAGYGHVASRDELREALRRREIGPDELPRVVRALGRGADSRDLTVLAEIFPLEDDLAGNVELARALVRAGTPEGIEVIRAALWREPWNRSALAGALLVHQRGIAGLFDELASPPAGATNRALRRVGFALGEWGGLAQAELLSRRRRSGDPALQGAYLGALCTRTH